MCVGCFTGVEAAAVQGAASVVLASGGLRRVREYVTGQGSIERRRAAYQANAEFLAGIGLDPDHVLGPPPAGTGG
jgi:hypothetical protein